MLLNLAATRFNIPLPYVFSIQITAPCPPLAQQRAENECLGAPWHLSWCLLCSFSCSPSKATTTTQLIKDREKMCYRIKWQCNKYNSWEGKNELLWEGKGFAGCLRSGCMVRRWLLAFWPIPETLQRKGESRGPSLCLVSAYQHPGVTEFQSYRSPPL